MLYVLGVLMVGWIYGVIVFSELWLVPTHHITHDLCAELWLVPPNHMTCVLTSDRRGKGLDYR